MTILKNTLEPLLERFDDPGDYPNALAQGPLPSYDYFAGIEGELVVELTPDELAEYAECPEDFLDNCDEITDALPISASSIKWGRVLNGNLLTLEILDCESDGREPDEPDWDAIAEQRQERDQS